MRLLGKIALAMLAPWTSRRLWMCIIGLLVINSLFWTATWYLYSFTEQWRGEIFYRMFASTMWGTTAIVFSYLGIQALMSGWTNTTAQTATSILQTALEKKESKQEIIVTERTPKAAYFDGEDVP